MNNNIEKAVIHRNIRIVTRNDHALLLHKTLHSCCQDSPPEYDKTADSAPIAPYAKSLPDPPAAVEEFTAAHGEDPTA
jgi:hypothetical protein